MHFAVGKNTPHRFAHHLYGVFDAVRIQFKANRLFLGKSLFVWELASNNAHGGSDESKEPFTNGAFSCDTELLVKITGLCVFVKPHRYPKDKSTRRRRGKPHLPELQGGPGPLLGVGGVFSDSPGGKL